MTKQKAIKIAKEKIAKCTSFVKFLDEDEKQNPDLSDSKLVAKIRWIMKVVTEDEAKTLEQIIEQIDSKKPAKSL